MNNQTRFMSDIGATLKGIEVASGRSADRIGKPETHAFKAILRDHFKDQAISELTDKFMMVGDNMESDILFGKNNSIDSCLVFTGVQKMPSSKEEYNHMIENLKPTFMCYNLDEKEY